MQFDRQIKVLNQDGSACEGKVFGSWKNSSCNIVFTSNGIPSINISGWDFYDCYLKLKDVLQEHRLKMLCKGSAIAFQHSGMSRDMSNGLRGYYLEIGKNSSMDQTVDIFDNAEESEIGSAEDQRLFFERWRSSIKG